MDAAATALQARLESLVRTRWSELDPDVKVSSSVRADGKVDMMVVSRLFAGKDGLKREAFFWPVFAPVPKSDLVHMTYCLLLTPEEAARHFAHPGPPPGQDNQDNWA
jgi:hypothetical protein